MNTEPLDYFDNKEKAIHHALWLNFKYRIAGITFGVIIAPNNNFVVIEEAVAKELGTEFLDIPSDYEEMNVDEIRHIRMDKNPLAHLSEIIGTFSVMDGELLRYILHSKIPLEKLIRYELALRGYDKNHRWCGFEKAEEIWLKEEQNDNN